MVGTFRIGLRGFSSIIFVLSFLAAPLPVLGKGKERPLQGEAWLKTKLQRYYKDPRNLSDRTTSLKGMQGTIGHFYYTMSDDGRCSDPGSTTLTLSGSTVFKTGDDALRCVGEAEPRDKLVFEGFVKQETFFKLIYGPGSGSYNGEHAEEVTFKQTAEAWLRKDADVWDCVDPGKAARAVKIAKDHASRLGKQVCEVKVFTWISRSELTGKEYTKRTFGASVAIASFGRAKETGVTHSESYLQFNGSSLAHATRPVALEDSNTHKTSALTLVDVSKNKVTKSTEFTAEVGFYCPANGGKLAICHDESGAFIEPKREGDKTTLIIKPKTNDVYVYLLLYNDNGQLQLIQHNRNGSNYMEFVRKGDEYRRELIFDDASQTTEKIRVVLAVSPIKEYEDLENVVRLNNSKRWSEAFNMTSDDYKHAANIYRFLNTVVSTSNDRGFQNANGEQGEVLRSKEKDIGSFDFRVKRP